MKKICTVAVILLLLFPCLIFAKYMAVLETLSPTDLLTRQERLYLTDILRGQAVYILPAEQNWTIMTRENINVMLPPGKKIEDCEGSCLAETGKNIAADYVAQARISQFGKSLAISAELYETASSKLVASFAGKGETVDDLENIIKKSAPTFFRKARDNALNGFGYVNNNSNFSFQGIKSFIVEVQTTPAGAIPTFDGKAYSQCTSTPCKIQLEAGEHRLLISKDRFVDFDTLINVTQNEQIIKLDLVPNVGYIDIKPQTSNAVKNRSPLNISINGKKAQLGTNGLTPGIYSVRITHECYDSTEFHVALQRGEIREITNPLTRSIGGLELTVTKNGEPQAVPIFIDNAAMGKTPFAGEVPLCSQIEIETDGKRIPVQVSLKYHEVIKQTFEINKQKTATTKADEIRQRAEVAYAELDGKKIAAKPIEEPPTVQADSSMHKRFWGGFTAGITYNDYYSSHFGLNSIKNETGYKHTVDGKDDLLGNFWGFGFKAGFGGLFIASPYFGLHGELGLALRQGTGKTNLSVTLSGKDKADKKSNLEIEYSASQLNIDIPLLARATIPNAFYLEAGPMMSFNLTSNSEAKITNERGTEKYKTDSGLNAFEFDIATGLGIARNLSKSILDFNLRFILGLTRISDSKDSPKTWQWQLNVTYWFL